VNLPSKESAGAGSFGSTRWTVVLAAAGKGATASQSHEALSELCRIYWRPVYLFLRRNGRSPDDAKDLTQGFFADLIATRSYARADREKGRFRSFLLGALKHFAADEYDREQAQKRGGGKQFEPLEESALREVEAQVSSSSQPNPDAAYERGWAAALLRQTFNRLAEECEMTGKTALYKLLQPYVAIDQEGMVPYAELSARLRRPESTLRSDLTRLRARYRAILREEVGGTVATPADVDDELRYLCRIISTT
jgi:RNA polymerase sigma factor (sigma-70 family)